ncbi:class I adenylate-forming enzyme family protein [Cupriavidus sp. AU9028]|uniref:class I adenylate-forming enzyme family protein n=1 Tax=Cupriavidus sp. AU9028 TaxID=2871157 RepID=UPI001C96FFA8|nr:AMP-binding protein [Cupriavidus sp. AU9028]MBY4897064.1 AMP-binding protein [Cupriavidus sp. AU9028]
MTQARIGGIEYWAQHKPHEVAFIEGERALTWSQLDEHANRLAEGLHRRGIGEGDIVAVRTLVRLEWVVTAGALAKLDCALLGVNWRLTASEAQHLLDDSGATALICDGAELTEAAMAVQRAGLSLAVSIDAPHPAFVSYADLIAAPAVPRQSQAEPRLLIYTSGTTGVPKGVAMGQGDGTDPAVLREYRESIEAAAGVGEVGVQLVTMPMHHASGPSQVWGAIRKGRRVVLMRRFEPEAALRAIQDHRVEMWAGVPTMFKRLAGLPPETLKGYDLSSIRRVSVGAAPVPYALKLWMLDTFGRHALQENYGATEVGMVCALTPEMQERKPGSSGKLFRHAQVEVRDAQGGLLPRGQIGELWVRTPVTIARYLNAGPMDAETMDARGFFRVGDVGYLDDEDYLFITDRVKDMIISGGVNIYPAEIEAALMRHGAIEDVAVIGIPHDEFGEQVMAFCQLKPGRSAHAAELMAHCAQHLASYKRPRRFEFVADLPRNGMGKVLKRELRDPYWIGKERKV